MKKRHSLLLAIVGAVALLMAAQVQAKDTAPPLVKQINNGNWLNKKEANQLRNELFYQRAIHAYMTMLPALNTIGIRDGSEAAL